ncbi:MAG: GumC family protein [Caulobacterales bacterium]
MASQGVFPARPAFRAGDTRRPGERSSRPRYALSDIPALLWRERWVMAGVFAAIAVLGLVVAFSLQTLYPAHSSVLVRLGQEYVYEPRAGDAGRGATPDNDHVLQSETEILGSDTLKAQVVRKLGVARLAPGESHAYSAASPQKREQMLNKLAFGIGRSLKIDTAPDAPVIRLTYENRDPQLSALVLNTLLEQYLVYRRAVLMSPTAGALDDQRRSFEQRLSEADAAYQSFLTSNQIGDFDAEKASLSQLAAQIEQQQYTTDSSLKEKSGRLAAIDAELAQVSPEVGLYHDADPTASAKLLDLKVQREGLLSRYRPDAQPVKDIEAQIARLESAIASGRAQGRGAERTGINPVYQTFQTEKLQLTAEVAALHDTSATLADQMSRLTERRLRLAELEPQYQALNRDRDVLSSNVRDFTVKAEQSQASQEIAAATNDNIRIVERATVPTQGKSLKRPVLVLVLLFAAFSALCAGLMRMFLRPGLPTPASASRTLDLPVLGAAGLKQPA